MRDVRRIEKILLELKEIWEKYPDLRLGQLLLNTFQEQQLYYLEDEEIIEKVKKKYQ